MEPDELPDCDELWWSWVLLAALHRSVGDSSCWFDADQLVLGIDDEDGSWLRMQRTHGRRTTLWGRSALAPASPPDARRGAPDWALTEATEERRPTFVAWHAHGEWDTSAPGPDEGALHLFRPMLTVDPRAVELVRSGGATPRSLRLYTRGPHLDEAAELARRAAAQAPRRSGGLIGFRLRDQVHEQMRDTVETDRMHMQRPPVLVQWLRANGPGVPFEYAAMVMRERLTPSPANTRLPPATERTLANVLRSLHQEEAGEDSGAWLFARVVSDGVVIRLERAFDGWPAWYRVDRASQGPTLEDLAWEMRQRERPWRPAWASLLPEPSTTRL